MSVKVQLLECQACKLAVYAFPMLPSTYVFATGELLRLRWAFGWCTGCSRVRQVEALPSMDLLDKEEADLRALDLTKPNGLDRYERQDLDRIDVYRRLVGSRKSPPHCMECGGTDIAPWSFDEAGEPIHNPHVGCEGRFQTVEDPDEMRIALIHDAECYSTEGIYLGRLSEQPGRDGTEDF